MNAVAEYYDELAGEDDQDENEDGELDEYSNETQHCLTALEFLESEPDDKLQVIKISNIPRQATEQMLLKQLQKHIKDLKYEKIVVEESKGKTAWISSNDKLTLRQLIKLHLHVSFYHVFNVLLGLGHISAKNIPHVICLRIERKLRFYKQRLNTVSKVSG